ncbi:Protein-tyrosine-phosphatase [Aphelenchoides fujianensis]|nr:Protein-tyrosine-phosphatase [Aphelenchoides fujianensis]
MKTKKTEKQTTTLFDFGVSASPAPRLHLTPRRRVPLREVNRNVSASLPPEPDIRAYFGSRKRAAVLEERPAHSKHLKLTPKPVSFADEDSDGGDNHNQTATSLRILHAPFQFHTAYHSIDGETLVEQLRLGEDAFLSKYVLYDCRWPYEYEHGHILYAENLFDQNQLEKAFFPKCSRIPIFYCEYSQQRGPGMARALRELDRQRNVAAYPAVDYAEIYVLDRGYKQFFSTHKEFCTPANYVPMDHPEFVDEERHYNTQRKDLKRTRAAEKRTRYASHHSSQPNF